MSAEVTRPMMTMMMMTIMTMNYSVWSSYISDVNSNNHETIDTLNEGVGFHYSTFNVRSIL